MSLVRRIAAFIKDSRQELAKVTWPAKKNVLRYTIFVVVAIIISAGIIFAFDVLLIKLVQILVVR